MTATMQTIDLVAAMADAATKAFAQASGVAATNTPPARIADLAASDVDSIAARSMLTVDGTVGGLVLVVPSSGLSPDAAGLSGIELVATLAEGAAAGFAAITGVAAQAAPPEALADTSQLAGADAEAYEFEIGTETDSVTIRWVVEASLGALVTGGDPVDPPAAEGPSVAPATLPELTQSVAPGRARDLQLLSNVPMNVTVEIGRGSVQVRELLSLVQGSIVELDRVVGSPVDVLVNGTLVAHGDIVLVGDELGVRVTEIVEQL